MLSPLCTPTAIPGLGSGTGTPDPRTRTPPPPTETPSPPPDSIGAPPGGPPPTPDPCGRITPEAIAQAGGMENYLWRESDTCTLTRVSMGESHENGPDRVLIMWLIKMRAELGFGNAPHRGWNPPHDRWGEPTSIKQEALDPKQFDSVAKAYATIDPEAWPETGNIRAMLSPTDNQLPNFQSTLQIAAEIAVQPLSSIPDHLKGYDEFRAFELGRGWIGAKQTESLAGANYYRDAYWIDNIHFGLISCESVRENNKVDFQCPGTPAP